MTKLIHLIAEIYAVEAPNDAHHIVIHNAPHKIVFSSQIQDPAQCGGDMICLPAGNWQFVCTTKECTTIKASEIVEHDGDGWKDYDKDLFHNDLPFPDPLDSLKSLLTSKGLDNKNYVLIKKLS